MELTDFFRIILGLPKGGKIPQITVKAFTMARDKIKPRAFLQIFHATRDIILRQDLKLFHGYQLIAIDATKLRMEKQKELWEYFGTGSGTEDPVMGRASTAFDVLNRIVLDAVLSPFFTGERRQAELIIRHLSELKTGSRKLLLFDRGYPSYRLMAQMEKAGMSYLMRIPRSFIHGLKSMKYDTKMMHFKYEKTSYKFLLIRIHLMLSNQKPEYEYLITNVKESLSLEEWKKLYALRWGTETNYHIFKNEIKIENYSGKTVRSVYQDFFANIFILNYLFCFTDISDEIIRKDIEEQRKKGKPIKHDYKTNLNKSIGTLKDEMVTLFLSKSLSVKEKIIKYVIGTIQKFRIPILSNRKADRSASHTVPYTMNMRYST